MQGIITMPPERSDMRMLHEPRGTGRRPLSRHG